MKKILTFCTVLALALAACVDEPVDPGTDPGDDPGKTTIVTVPPFPYVTSEVTWTTAVNTIKTGGNYKAYTINVTNDFALTGIRDVYETFGNTSNITVTINGKDAAGEDAYREISLKAGTKGRLFRIGSKQTVIINNIGLIGHDTNDGELVYVDGAAATNTNNDNAVFTMKGSSSVSYNNGDLYGAVEVVRGTFNMEGSSEVSYNYNKNRNGGLCVNGGFFTMKGNSSVHHNKAQDVGGVLVTHGTVFNMLESATINDNEATDKDLGYGGGVAISTEGTFNMRDSALIYNNKAGLGGGVYLDASGGTLCTFNMYGGEIAGNTATSSASYEGGGGGVYVANKSAFRIMSGTIWGNGDDVTPANWKNLATGTGGTGAALYIKGTGTAERGTYSNATWSRTETLLATSDTLKVLNGAIQ